uniref:heme-binding protein 2-like n=1 Tax=Ciona intestinalis TaxID=7719 RepID=UPI00006A4CD4|nr:heme-binding protein 2-like [Ciona intestinalis]|eukprot:XP_002129980.1 heme-binding protein 2-like [Ciona intestinalis]
MVSMVGLVVCCMFVPLVLGDWADTAVGYEHPVWNLTDNQPKDGSYQVRRYAPCHWVTTNVTAWTWDEAGGTGFKRLFAYINGDNNRGVKIDMTVPVVVKITSNPCVFCQNVYTVYFYIPQLYQANPPTPTDPSVKVKFLDKPWVEYARRFTGFAEGMDPFVETNQLWSDMERNGVNCTKIFDSYMYMASFDSPFKMFHRHNEVSLQQQAGK